MVSLYSGSYLCKFWRIYWSFCMCLCCAAELQVLAMLCADVLVGCHCLLHDCPDVDLRLPVWGHSGSMAEFHWHDWHPVRCACCWYIQGVPKNDPICFCQNFVESPPNLIIFGTRIAETIEICEVHSLFISSNLWQCTTVLKADALNCCIMLSCCQRVM